MGSLASFIRSAARATYSAYRSVPIRWRLAGGSAALTFVILAGFAAIVGTLINRQVRTQFADQQTFAVDKLYSELNGKLHFTHGTHVDCKHAKVSLGDYASAEHAEIRIFDTSDGVSALQSVRDQRDHVPSLSRACSRPSRCRARARSTPTATASLVRQLDLRPAGTATLLYALPLSDVDHTAAEVQIFLLLGVLGGTVAALIAGLFVSARAMRPIVELTDAAREIERTRDASGQIPHPEAEDEIAELARTLEGMLGALDNARSHTQTMLDRQREFVADASHELRTPLTSVLANLELLDRGTGR